MSETPLFPGLPENLSPRLAWMKRHGVETYENSKEFIGMTVAETGEEVPAWVCRTKKPEGNFWFTSQIASGNTEDEAIMNFCVNSGISHWTVSERTEQVPANEKNQGGSR